MALLLHLRSLLIPLLQHGADHCRVQLRLCRQRLILIPLALHLLLHRLGRAGNLGLLLALCLLRLLVHVLWLLSLMHRLHLTGSAFIATAVGAAAAGHLAVTVGAT